MAKHILSLEIPDVMNKSILRVIDTSVYASSISVVNPLLQITPPGFIHPSNIEQPVIQANFSINATACDLQLQTDGCNDNLYNIQDGLYVIKYSVEPKDIIYVEYNHLRITCALNKIKEIYCELDLGACEASSDLKQKLNQLRLIEQYFKAAKANIEVCHNPKKGMELYTYALKLLDRLSCSTSCKSC